MTDVQTPRPRQEAPGTGPGRDASSPEAGWLRWGWRQLTSMRTALVLLLLLALAAIPGSLVPQRTSDPNGVLQFQQNDPETYDVLNRFGLFETFGSPWFSAIYILLFVSLIGCIVPRTKHHFDALRARPPRTPARLERLAGFETAPSATDPERAIAEAQKLLTASGYRTERYGTSVSAERGYLRETGNLVFHVSLVVLLVGIALTGLYGFKGTVLVTDGGSFANAREFYDVFEPSRLYSDSQLAPFSFTLDKFSATYQPSGEPTSFDAKIHYRSSPDATPKPYDIRVNHPLDIDGAKLFLVGHGYSLRISVTNPAGQTVYDGATPFLPDDSMFTSHGVVKIPDFGGGKQLGLTGFFYPTAAITPSGSLASVFPGPKDPVLSLAAWRGNLGMDSGAPQSVYSLDVAALKNIGVTQLTPGKSWKLRDGTTVTFHGIDQWATFQVAHEPGKRTLLVGAILVIAGLLASLRVRRRRFWLRAIPAAADDPDRRTVVMAAGLARSEADSFGEELEDLVGRIATGDATPAAATETERDE